MLYPEYVYRVQSILLCFYNIYFYSYLVSDRLESVGSDLSDPISLFVRTEPKNTGLTTDSARMVLEQVELNNQISISGLTLYAYKICLLRFFVPCFSGGVPTIKGAKAQEMFTAVQQQLLNRPSLN